MRCELLLCATAYCDTPLSISEALGTVEQTTLARQRSNLRVSDWFRVEHDYSVSSNSTTETDISHLLNADVETGLTLGSK